jgi:hypothetical protein
MKFVLCLGIAGLALTLPGPARGAAAGEPPSAGTARESGIRAAEPAVPQSSPILGDAWHDPRNPIVRLFGGERLDLWSLKPIQRSQPPVVQNSDWVRNPIDSCIAARLEAEGLDPAPEADRRILARRAAFDLTGLPPTPEEMEQFLADRRPEAYERFVDKLLDSPRSGEHLARMWLDVVRYSDSNGFDWDEFRPQAWRFRDYVIRSFNADKPFDRFLTEQLAGDELFEGPPRTVAEQDSLIATGFLRLGPHDNAAPLFNEQDRSRAELLADVVETTGSAFLGLTLACCRCHDHKYDPLSQADHFRLRAFFEPMAFADNLPLDLADKQASINSENAELEKQQSVHERERDELLGKVKQRIRTEHLKELNPDERTLLDLPPDKQTETQQEQVAAVNDRLQPSDQEMKDALDIPAQKQLEVLEAAIADLQGRRRKFVTGLVMTNCAEDVPATQILYQGDHRAPREAVVPGFLSVLDPNPAELGPPGTPPGLGRRRVLARWLTSPDNPLTARVFVNRLWQMHFGRGIVATPNDFGLAGARPTHPELLDWLAGEFIRRNWSVKQLQRLIVTSATYRQGSAAKVTAVSTTNPAKPDSRDGLFGHQAARRLTAEQLRDALLAVSGLLTDKSDGPPVWPDLPEEILNANPAFLDDNELKIKGWYPSPAAEQPARSIFLVQKRAVRVPFLETFDLPENMVSCARRNVSTVAPQALSLLNSSLAAEAAQSFAARVAREAGGSPTDQIQRAFALALQRPPSGDESAACLQFLRMRSLAELCRVILNLNEFLYLD